MEKSKLNYELKDITLAQRGEINDNLYKDNIGTASILACKYGLLILNGQPIDSKSDYILNQLSIDEISMIGAEVIEKMNFPKKKSSKSD